jgi:hypothetical protein
MPFIPLLGVGFFRYCGYVYVLPSEIQLSRDLGCVPVNRFNYTPFVVPALSQYLDFQRHMSWSFFCSVSSDRMRCVSLCVDIGGIDNHHCLNFLFIIGQVDTLIQSDTLCLECQCETQLNISTIDYFNVKHSWLFLPLTTSMWNTSDYFCHWLLHCETQLTISTIDYFNVKHSWLFLPLTTSM